MDYNSLAKLSSNTDSTISIAAGKISSSAIVPNGQVVVHLASTPQVRILFSGWTSLTQPFISTAVGR
ncbi:hypothetical protein TNCV_1546061 [Trichonephila clavipes]|nr:hypothetical protein TNCV_1546061 [Trichonephila clavipes]